MILVDSDTRVLVQGITGKQGSFNTRLMQEYGTRVVAGVTPGKGGEEVHGVRVFNTVGDAMDRLFGSEHEILPIPAPPAVLAGLARVRGAH